MFEAENLRIHRHGSTLLSVERWSLPAPGALFLLGSGGTGKSSTLAALAGVDVNVGCEGNVRLQGRALQDLERCHVPQRQRDTTITSVDRYAPTDAAAAWDDIARCGGPDLRQSHVTATGDGGRSLRRMLDVMSLLARPVDLYLVDEPTFGLDDEHADIVRTRVRELASTRQLVVATHNRQDCLAIGGWCALLAGGEVQELATTDRFFNEPGTAAGRQYVHTGGCSLPTRQPAGDDPGGIWWAVRGLLGGMSRPGIGAPLQAQATSLHENGVRHLVCLEERRSYPTECFRQLDISCHHVPVPDMAAPSFQQAVDLCRRMEPEIRENRGVVMHCRGGLGRTGTLLACIFVWFGDAPADAVDKIRSARPLAIQSDAQIRFIHDFADRISGWFTAAKAVNLE